ncbi:MAG: hypothetical protein AB1814_04905 [Thermodesulfobacteriota bacterium]
MDQPPAASQTSPPSPALPAALAQAGIAPWLAGFILLIFAVAIVLVGLQADAWQTSPTLNLLIGALIALVGQVGQYYFGSSAGSKKKTELLAQEMNKRPAG